MSLSYSLACCAKLCSSCTSSSGVHSCMQHMLRELASSVKCCTLCFVLHHSALLAARLQELFGRNLWYMGTQHSLSCASLMLLRSLTLLVDSHPCQLSQQLHQPAAASTHRDASVVSAWSTRLPLGVPAPCGRGLLQWLHMSMCRSSTMHGCTAASLTHVREQILKKQRVGTCVLRPAPAAWAPLLSAQGGRHAGSPRSPAWPAWHQSGLAYSAQRC